MDCFFFRQGSRASIPMTS